MHYVTSSSGRVLCSDYSFFLTHGSVYVYRAGHTKGVHGFMTENPDGTYVMHLFSNHEGELSSLLLLRKRVFQLGNRTILS